MKVKYLFLEGISNLNSTFIQDVLEFFDKETESISMFSQSRTFEFNKVYTVTNKFFDNDDIDILVYINLLVDNKTGATVKMNDASKNIYRIQIHVNSYYGKKELVRSALVHELAHISQVYNGALKFNQQKFLEKKRKPGKNLYARYYYKKNHSSFPAEQEAVLLSLLQFIKDSKFDVAILFLLDHSKYLRNFTYKQILKKAYEFGIDNTRIAIFKMSINRLIESILRGDGKAEELNDDIETLIDLKNTLDISNSIIEKLKGMKNG
jgi:hypothetical protein